MDENRIQINEKTFEEFYGDMTEILLKMADTCSLSHYIILNDLPFQVSGKNFCISEAAEIMRTFYGYFEQNLKQLNTFYSKCFEYLQFVASEMKLSDKRLAKVLEERFPTEGAKSTSGGGSSSGGGGGRMISCPMCFKKIRADATKCTHCGHAIFPSPVNAR